MEKWLVIRKDLDKTIDIANSKEEAVIKAKDHFNACHVNMCDECNLVEEFSDNFVKLEFNIIIRAKCSEECAGILKNLNIENKIEYNAEYYIKRNR